MSIGRQGHALIWHYYEDEDLLFGAIGVAYEYFIQSLYMGTKDSLSATLMTNAN